MMLLPSVNLETLEVLCERPDVSIIPSSRSVVSLIRVSRGDKTNSSRYYKLTIERLDKEFWQKHFQKWYQFTIRRVATVKCEWWWQLESVSPPWISSCSSSEPGYKLYLSILYNVFVKIAECICTNCRMYFYELLNVLGSNGDNAKAWVRPE